jgi:tRNA threonylcarbamoyladenosine biosynthesis protein TsaB
MWVLALDTTTRAGSSALLRDGVVIEEIASDPALSQAQRVPAELIALLDRHDVPLSNIDAFAVGTGPGSFTGLRVGIAAMQGLACAEQKPLVGISTLDALAHIVGYDDDPAVRVATWVDAWRGEVYAASYVRGAALEPPTVELPDAILGRLHGGTVTFVGDGAGTYEPLIHDTLGTRARIWTPVHPLLAGAIGHLAIGQLHQGRRPGPEAIRPLYVRRPDAELARDGRR